MSTDKEISFEIQKDVINKEVDSFVQLLNKNNSLTITIKSINRTSRFWLNNKEKFPNIAKLANILLNINSSSSSVERFFSICGINNKKNRSNIKTDLFTTRCLLRANLKILEKLNSISE